ADPVRLQRDAPALLDRAVVAQQLLDRVRRQVRVLAQRLQLVGVPQQCQRAVPDEVDRGLVPGDVEQADLRDQFLVGEHVAVVLGRDEGGQQVVRRVLALPLDGEIGRASWRAWVQV